MKQEEKFKKIFKLFIHLGRRLNAIGIKPVMYGSLGLYFLTKNIVVNDIDFLLADKDFDRGWNDIQKLLKENKCEIDPEHEREFDCGGIFVSFLKLSEISHLVKVNFSRLERNEYKGIVYRSLALRQHLAVYQNGLKNKWRREKKKKDDLGKIEIIKECIKRKKRHS